MDERIERLNLIISRMINSFILEPDYFAKLYNEFVIEYYRKLDENNKDEYYYKVKQTYDIFIGLINEKSEKENK